MTPTQQAFLSILRAALHGGEDYPDISADQWPELLRLAQDHKVLPLVFETVHLRLRREVPELAAAVRGQVRNLVILQTLRTAFPAASVSGEFVFCASLYGASTAVQK